MPQSRGNPISRENHRPRRRQIMGGLALAWASGVVTVLIVWGLLHVGQPIDWTAGVAIALVAPTMAICALAWTIRRRADRLGPDDTTG